MEIDDIIKNIRSEDVKNTFINMKQNPVTEA
jgi:hypothetical protein